MKKQGIFSRFGIWWGRVRNWLESRGVKNPVRQKLIVVYAGGLGLFCIALLLKATAMLIEAAVIGVGSFLALWTIWSFLAQRFPSMEKFRANNPMATEIFAFGFPSIVFGGTIVGVIGGLLMGALTSFWNMSSVVP